jgi:hypothetical protein
MRTKVIYDPLRKLSQFSPQRKCKFLCLNPRRKEDYSTRNRSSLYRKSHRHLQKKRHQKRLACPYPQQRKRVSSMMIKETNFPKQQNQSQKLSLQKRKEVCLMTTRETVSPQWQRKHPNLLPSPKLIYSAMMMTISQSKNPQPRRAPRTRGNYLMTLIEYDNQL